MGAESFTDYARAIPGLTFQDSGAGRQTPTIRGVNPTAGAPAVAYYIDETPMAPALFGFVANPELIDIARIEVLRGPQGTLYGSSSIGGTIKLVPNTPNLSKIEGSVKATALVTQGADGASPGEQTELVLNMPIMEDRIAVRGAFWNRDAGGYINRTYGYVGDYGGAIPPRGKVGNLPDEHTWGFRITGLFRPSERLDISAMAYVQRQRFDGFSDITGGANNANNQLVQNLLADVPERQENTFELYNITAKYDFGRLNLVSSTSYSGQGLETDEEGMSAIQLLPTFLGLPSLGVAFPNTADVLNQTYAFTEEARAATSETIAGFDGVVGVFFTKRYSPGEFHWSPQQYNALVAGNDPTNVLYAPDNNVYGSWGTQIRERQTAEFGELTYHVTKSLRVTGGVRHYHVANDSDVFIDGWFIGGNTPGIVSETKTSSRTRGFVYKGNLSYQITSDHLLYAQYSEGFRPGFGNPPLPPICDAASNQLEVQPDSIKNYELGAKTEWLDHRLTVDGAAYRINWNNIQQGILLQCGLSTISNFGSAVVKGAELEINGQLTPRISGGLSATYLHAKLQQDLPLLGALAGDQIEQVPNWQYALYAQTTFPVLETNDGYARLDYQYTGSSFYNYARLSDGTRDPASEIQVVRLLSLRAGLRHRMWEFALSGQNLLNTTARQSLDPNAFVTFSIPGRPRYVVTRPRTFLLSAIYHF
jgi:outer membrane receptor protein involved in Fe transport